MESGRGGVPHTASQRTGASMSDHKGKDCPRACRCAGPLGVKSGGLTAFPLTGSVRCGGRAEECVVVDRSDVVVDSEDRFSSTNTTAEEIADKVCVEKGVSSEGKEVGKGVKVIDVDEGDGAFEWEQW